MASGARTTTQIHRLSRHLAVAQKYDASVKADLFATTLAVNQRLYLIDPFPLDRLALKELTGPTEIAGIVVTNENHHRASLELANTHRVQIYADTAAGIPGSRSVDEISTDLTAIALPGAPAGEIALHDSADGGTLIIGDALINFGSHGFAFLPAKYLRNATRMRQSLRALLDLEFERMLFAHGTPIVVSARKRLATLLTEV